MKPMNPNYARLPNETILQQALRILETVDESEWLTDRFTDQSSKCCAIGHFKRLTSDNPKDYSLSNCALYDHPLRTESAKALNHLRNIDMFDMFDLASINNSSETNGYNEPSIKARVLHFLRDAVAAGF